MGTGAAPNSSRPVRTAGPTPPMSADESAVEQILYCTTRGDTPASRPNASPTTGGIWSVGSARVTPAIPTAPYLRAASASSEAEGIPRNSSPGTPARV